MIRELKTKRGGTFLKGEIIIAVEWVAKEVLMLELSFEKNTDRVL